MEKFISLILLYVLFQIRLIAQTPSGMLLNKDFVDLKGKTATTVFINSTTDTLKLQFTFFNWLPYSESRKTIIIEPGQKDSISFTYNFPDFIHVNNRFMVYNSPGRRLVCNIKSLKPKNMEIVFEGFLAQENTYYRAYHNFLGNYDDESRAYYALSDRLKDWNRFPAKADSITDIRLNFLTRYQGSLPQWFKKHERRRLLYNGYFRLANALVSKEYYSGHKIEVKDDYYSFEKLLNQQDDMILNDIYFYCMNDALGLKERSSRIPSPSNYIHRIDSIYHKSDVGDVNMMAMLGWLYLRDKSEYDSLIRKIEFKEPERKIWIDSLIQRKLGLPLIGKKAPKMALVDMSGNFVSLEDYAGKIIILNFWAVWCGPCKAELSYENQIYEQYKNKGLLIVNVCVDSNKASWMNQSKKYNLQMVNLYCNQDDYSKLIKHYNLASLPRSILLDYEGIVIDNYFKRASHLTDNDLIKALEYGKK